MALYNKYVLDVDLKRELTSRQVTLAQGESGLLIFRIFDDGEEYNFTSATKAMIHHRTPSQQTIPSECEITTYEGQRVVKYEYEKIATIETGISQLVLTIYEGDYVVSVRPFPVVIYPNLQGGAGSYLELIKDLMDIIDGMIIDLNNTIKLSEKGKPNGVATLDKDGIIPVVQMPKEFDAYLEHIKQTVYKDQVHGMLISEDGIMQYTSPLGNQNVGFAPEAVTGGAGQVVNAKVTVNEGVATVTYMGIPTVIAQKWSVGERDLPYFTLSGTTFNGITFDVKELGLHTLWYKDSNSNTYTHLFNVNTAQLPSMDISVEVIDGVATVTTSKPTSLMKWDKGQRDVAYFQYNGNIVTANSFTVKEVGTHTVYVKTSTGLEYVKVFTVTQAMLPTPDTTAPTMTYTLTPSGNQMIIIVDAVDKESGVDYITLPNGTVVYTTNSAYYEVSVDGTYKFKATDKAGNTAELNVTVNGVAMKEPVIALNYSPTTWTTGNVTMTAYATSSLAGGNIVTKKWASGDQTKAYFASQGNVFTTDNFVVTDNGTYTVYAKDNYGAEAVKTIEVTLIDRQKPSMSLPITPQTATSGTVTINSVIFDLQSGIKVKKWSSGIRDVNYFTTAGTVFTDSNITVTSNGTYSFYAQDNAGNVTVETVEITNIANIAPTLTLSANPTAWTNNPVTVTINDTPAGGTTIATRKWASGSRNIAYFATGGTTLTGTTFSATFNGVYTVYVKDSAGNETVQTINIQNIDTSVPTLTLSVSGTGSSKTIIVTAGDIDSGINRIVLPDGTSVNSTQVTYTANFNGTYEFVAYNNAGSSTVKSTTITGITVNSQSMFYNTLDGIFKVDVGGSVYAQGDNTSGAKGIGTLSNNTSSNTPIQSLVSGITKVVGGYGRTFMLSKDGSVYLSGSNNVNGYYFTNLTGTEYSTPTKIPEITDAVDIVSGLNGATLFYKKSNGDWYGMGNNSNGQLGIGYTTIANNGYVKVPVKISTFSTAISMITTQNASTIFLLSDGYAYFAGRNDLPYGTYGGNTVTPSRIMYNNGVHKYKFVTLDETARNAYFIKDDSGNSVYVMGFNYNGELGLGHDMTVTDGGLINNNVYGSSKIQAGNGFALFMLSNGTVKAVGRNRNIAQGDNSNYITTPINLSFTGTARDISVSRSQAIITTATNRVYGMGTSNYNVFANGDANIYTTVTRLTNIE